MHRSLSCKCCEFGLVFEVELYLSAGQSPNQTALHVPRGVVSLPLALAASRGQSEVGNVTASTFTVATRKWARTNVALSQKLTTE